MENNNITLPKCAIVIATHNNAEWLLGAIQSAANSDFPNKIIYVVDDNSTDNTLEVMGNIPAFTSPSIVLQTQEISQVSKTTSWHDVNGCHVLFISLKENHGPSFARNVAIQNAIHINQCQIISILDSDDQLFPTKISKCVSAILSDPQTIGGVYADYGIMNVDTLQITYESKWAYDIFKLRQESIVHSGAVYSSLALEHVKQTTGSYYPPINTCEDFFINRVIAQRFLFIHLAEMLTLVRAHNNSSVNYRSKEEWQKNYQIAMSVPL